MTRRVRTNLWNSEFQVKKVGIFYNDEALSIAYCCLRSRPIYLNVVCQSVSLPCSKSNVLTLTY